MIQQLLMSDPTARTAWGIASMLLVMAMAVVATWAACTLFQNKAIWKSTIMFIMALMAVYQVVWITSTNQVIYSPLKMGIALVAALVAWWVGDRADDGKFRLGVPVVASLALVLCFYYVR